jgi:hypothetical protein
MDKADHLEEERDCHDDRMTPVTLAQTAMT